MSTSPVFFLIYFLIVFLQTSMVPESAATVRTITTGSGDSYLIFEGLIDQGSAKRVHDHLRDITNRFKGVVIDSPGGLLTESIKISKDVLDNQLAVIVPKNSICASGCFLVFAASHDRLVSTSAKVGVHSAKSTDPSILETGNDNQVSIMRLFKVPVDIIGRAVTTPASDIYWLTKKDLLSMNTRIIDVDLLRGKKR